MSTAASQALVQKLYVAYYGRPADPVGLEVWALAIDANKGQVSTAIVNAFGASAESTALFGNMSTSQKVNAIYKQLFGRDAEPAGLLAWATAIDDGRVSAAGAALEILNGAAGDDKTTINNKLKAAAAFTAALDTTAEITAYSGDTVANAARSFLAGVTTATPSTDAVNTAVATVLNNVASTGSTFTLTVNTDNIVGTSGNDVINAAYVTGSNGGGSFNSLDVISGGAGTDTLNIEYGQTINGTITGVEKVFYKGLMTSNGQTGSGSGSNLQTVDASKVGGLEQLWFDNATENATGTGGDMAITSLATGQAVGFKGKMTGAGTGDAFEFAASYGTGATTATVALDGASAVYSNGTGVTGGIKLKLDGSKLDTVAVSGDGELKLVAAGTGVGSAVKTLNITGGSGKAAVVNVDTTSTGTGDYAFTAINKVTTAGDTKLNLKGLNTDLSYTGGAGADTLTLSLQGLDSKDSISMGSGTDRLVLAVDATGSNTAESSGEVTITTTGLTQINKIAVEELQIRVDGATTTTGSDKIVLSLDASKFTNAGALVLGGWGGTTSTGTGTGFQTDLGTGDTFANKVTNLVDTTKLIADGSSVVIGAFAKLGDDGKIASGAGTVNVQVLKDKSVTIAANEGATGASNTGNYNKLVITGDGAATYTASTATGTGFTSKDVTIDASGQSATGKLTFTGSAAGVEKISLGAGKDVITESAYVSSANVAYSTYAKTDVITGFAKGDTLVIANGAGTGDKVDASSELVKFDPTGAVSFEQALTQAAAAAGSTKAAWFNWTDGNTYIVQDTDGTGTAVVDQNSGDLVIKLVGSLTLTTDATLGGITVA